jgi:adenylate cyclase
LAFALDLTAWVHFYRGEPQAAQTRLDPLSLLVNEQGFQFFAAESAILQGWVMTEQGREAEGLARMRPGVVAYHAAGAEMSRPAHLGLLAKTYGKVGQLQEECAALAEAFAVMDKTGEYCLEAELYRVKGELVLKKWLRDWGRGGSSSSPRASGREKRQKAKDKGQKSLQPSVLSSQFSVPHLQPLISNIQEAESYFLLGHWEAGS